MAATTQVRLLVWSCRCAKRWRYMTLTACQTTGFDVRCGHAYAFQTGAQTADAAARAHMASISCPSGSGDLRLAGVPGHHSPLSDLAPYMLARDLRPHRLVVRTSRCGRDNPGSTPGVVMQVRQTVEIHDTDRMPDNRFRCQVWSRIRIPDWSAKCMCSGPGTHDINIMPHWLWRSSTFRCPWAPTSS